MKDKKRPMGRGLSAILNAESKNTINSASDEGAKQIVGSVVEVSIEDILPNPEQPRTYFDQEALQNLAESIMAYGLIQPITLRKEEDKFRIISGERRFRASKIAGLKSIPAYIRLADDHQMLQMALVENIQREDLDMIEIALTYQRLIEELEMTQEELSTKIGKDRSTITNTLRLLKLSPEIQEAIRKGLISPAHGRTILALETPELQAELFELIIKEKLSVRQAEKWILDRKVRKERRKNFQKEVSHYHRKVQKNLSDLLELKVEIKTSANGKKGKLVLDFSSEEELESIIAYFKQE